MAINLFWFICIASDVFWSSLLLNDFAYCFLYISFWSFFFSSEDSLVTFLFLSWVITSLFFWFKSLFCLLISFWVFAFLTKLLNFRIELILVEAKLVPSLRNLEVSAWRLFSCSIDSRAEFLENFAEWLPAPRRNLLAFFTLCSSNLSLELCFFFLCFAISSLYLIFSLLLFLLFIYLTPFWSFCFVLLTVLKVSDWRELSSDSIASSNLSVKPCLCFALSLLCFKDVLLWVCSKFLIDEVDNLSILLSSFALSETFFSLNLDSFTWILLLEKLNASSFLPFLNLFLLDFAVLPAVESFLSEYLLELLIEEEIGIAVEEISILALELGDLLLFFEFLIFLSLDAARLPFS